MREHPSEPAEIMRQVVARPAGALGFAMRFVRVPRWTLRAMGIFSPLVRAVAEMAHRWDLPFVSMTPGSDAAFAVTPSPS